MRARSKPRSRERYILDSVETLFKGGGWVEITISPDDDVVATNPVLHIKGGEGVSGRGDVKDSMSSRYMTIIGGQKYDGQALDDHLAYVPPRTKLCVGVGRGVEDWIVKNAPCDYGLGVRQLALAPDLYGKNARKVNVEQVLCFAPDSPLLLVGDGTRVKQARSWLDRTKSRREVIELP